MNGNNLFRVFRDAHTLRRWRRVELARPRPVRSNACHQNQPAEADADLRRQAIGIHLEDEMTDERQKDADAKYFERPLTAKHERSQQARVQACPILRNDANHDHGESQKVQYTVGRQIRLIVGNDDFEPSGRHEACRPESDGHCHDEREENKDDACGQDDP